MIVYEEKKYHLIFNISEKDEKKRKILIDRCSDSSLSLVENSVP